MSVFFSGYTPHLLNRIQIRRIRRHLDKFDLCKNIRVLCKFLLAYETLRFLVPRSVIHNQSIFFAFRCRVGKQKRANGMNGRFIIKFFGFCNKQFPCFWNDKTAVRNLIFARKRFDFGFAPCFIPGACNCRLNLKMYFILIYQDEIIGVFYISYVFLNSIRSTVSSYPLLGYV